MKTKVSHVCLVLSLLLGGAVPVLAENVYSDSVLQTIQNAVKEQQAIKDNQAAPVGAEAKKPETDLEQPLKAMTLEQALRASILRNPEFKSAQARLGVSNAEILTAGARLNPALMSDNGIAEKTYRLGLEQTLELGGKRRKRVALANAQQDALLSEINTRLLDLRISVRQAYTRFYNAQERQRTYQNLLEVTKELVEIARKRETAGDISKLDTLQTEILNVNANNDLQFAAAEVVNEQNQLNALLNQPLTTELHVAPPTLTPQLGAETEALQNKTGETVLQGHVTHSELDLDSLIAMAMSRRPEIQQNLKNIKVTALQTALARANRVPNLMLTAGADMVTGEGQKAMNAFITGRVELPVMNRQQGPIAEALARKAVLEQEQIALKNKITLEVSKAYTSFKANQARIDRYESQLLPYSIAVVDKSRRAFEEGKTGILMAINAQQAYMNTRLGYLQALMDYQNTMSDLERAIGSGL